MKTLKEAKACATEVAKHRKHYPKMIIWIEKVNSQFKVFNNLSGIIPENPQGKKRIFA